MCEEFGYKPEEAVEAPLALCLRIMAYRAYARAKALVDNADADHKPPDWAKDAVYPVIQERQRRKAAKREEASS